MREIFGTNECIGCCHDLYSLLLWARASTGMNIVRNVWTSFSFSSPQRFVAQETAEHIFQVSKYPQSSLFSLQSCTSLLIHMNSDAYVLVTHFTLNLAVEAMQTCGKIPFIIIERQTAATVSQTLQAFWSIVLRSFGRQCRCLF